MKYHVSNQSWLTKCYPNFSGCFANACIQNSEETHQKSCPVLFSPFGVMSGNGTLLQFVWLCTIANRDKALRTPRVQSWN